MPGDGAVGSAVQGIVAIVAQNKELIFAALERLVVSVGAGKSGRSWLKVGFVEPLPINKNRTVSQQDLLPSERDDALNGKSLVGGVANDNDF